MVAAYQTYAQNAAGGGSPAVVTKPTGTVDGDLLVAIGITNGTTITVGAGGAAWVQPSWSLGGQVPIWTKKALSEPENYTFSPVGGVLQFTGAMVVRFNATHATTPIDTGSGHSVFGNIVLPTITPSGGNRLLAQILLKASTSNSWSPPGTATERFDAVVNNLSSALGDEVVGASATGTRTWTPTDTGAGAVGYMMAIAPATQALSQSADLVGAGTVTRSFDVGDTESLTGDGTITRALSVAESKNLTGDGVVTRQVAAGLSRSLTGDGTVTETHNSGLVRSFDLTGDGTVTRSLTVTVARDLTGDGTITAGKAVTASKTFDLTGDGTITESHAAGLSRTFDLVGDGVISGSADIPFPDIPECALDWFPNDGLKAIAGTVLFHEPPNEGDPVSGATVCLYRDSDGVRIECTTTAPDGTYTFARDTNDPYTYHVEVTYTDGGGTQQGLSESGCVPL